MSGIQSSIHMLPSRDETASGYHIIEHFACYEKLQKRKLSSSSGSCKTTLTVLSIKKLNVLWYGNWLGGLGGNPRNRGPIVYWQALWPRVPQEKSSRTKYCEKKGWQVGFESHAVCSCHNQGSIFWHFDYGNSLSENWIDMPGIEGWKTGARQDFALKSISWRDLVVLEVNDEIYSDEAI